MVEFSSPLIVHCALYSSSHHQSSPSKAEFYKGIATQLIQLGGEIPSNLHGFQAALILRDLDLISSHPQLGKLFLTQIILSSPDDPAHLKNDELIEEFHHDHIPSRNSDLLHSELEEKGDGESKTTTSHFRSSKKKKKKKQLLKKAKNNKNASSKGRKKNTNKINHHPDEKKRTRSTPLSSSKNKVHHETKEEGEMLLVSKRDIIQAILTPLSSHQKSTLGFCINFIFYHS